ncbi:hypothetical protein NX059_003278 [Plenodomus lindquistii]|nr:hypothetical protein NX059_003278 [Plenodomus lindquistii]
MDSTSGHNNMAATVVELSEWSQKFYNGTFTWSAEGFTDDEGVYRDFDCYDPLARAPTPLPPVFPSDDEDEEHAIEDLPVLQEVDTTIGATETFNANELNARQEVVLAFGNWSEVKSGADGSRPFALTSDLESSAGAVNIRNDSVFSSEFVKEAVSEGIKGGDGIVQKQEQSDSSQSADHKSSGLPQPSTAKPDVHTAKSLPRTPEKKKSVREEEQHSSAKRQTPHIFSTPSSLKIKIKLKPRNPPTNTSKPLFLSSSPASTLSDCPSNLSNASVSTSVNPANHLTTSSTTPSSKLSKRPKEDEEESTSDATPTKKARVENTPDANAPPRKKGVAQKVIRKKGTNSSPAVKAARKTKAVKIAEEEEEEPPVVLEVESGAYVLDEQNRRRSSRQATRGKRG